jgi:glycosyltransferase involved in cell wall biosynthesis
MLNKRVFIVGEFSYPEGGAATKRISSFCQGFAQNGYQVYIIGLAVYNSNKKKYSFEEINNNIFYLNNTSTSKVEFSIVNKGIINKLIWFYYSYFGSFQIFFKVWKKFKFTNDDVVMLYGRNFFKLWPFTLHSKNKRPKIILDVVEHLSIFSGYAKYFNPLYWDWYLGFYFLPRKVDLITCITYSLDSIFKRKNLNSIVIPSVSTWTNTIQKIKIKDKISFLYIGALLDKDAASNMIEIFKCLFEFNNEVSLIIAGKYLQTKRGIEIYNYCKEDPILKERIIFYGEFSQNDFDDLMQKADCLVLLRRSDKTEEYSFPTRLIEYLKTGKPVVISDVGDISKYLDDGQDAILLDPYNNKANANKINVYLNDKKFLVKIGENGYLKGKLHFSIDNEIIKILSNLKT